MSFRGGIYLASLASVLVIGARSADAAAQEAVAAASPESQLRVALNEARAAHGPKRRHPPRRGQPWRKREHHESRPTESTDVDADADEISLVLGVDRVTSVLHWTLQGVDDVTGTESESSGTDVSFLTGGSAANANLFAVSRVSFDMLYGVVTVGGSLGYMHSSQPGGDGDVFLLHPRVGALFPRSTRVQGWLRGGVSYLSLSTDVVGTTFNGERVTLAEVQASMFALTLEPLFVVKLGDVVGLTMGPAFDIGFAGSATVEQPNPEGGTSSEEVGKVRLSSYGVTAGLIAVF